MEEGGRHRGSGGMHSSDFPAFAGMVLIGVDGVDIRDLRSEDIAPIILGEPGSMAELHFHVGGGGCTMQYALLPCCCYHIAANALPPSRTFQLPVQSLSVVVARSDLHQSSSDRQPHRAFNPHP